MSNKEDLGGEFLGYVVAHKTDEGKFVVKSEVESPYTFSFQAAWDLCRDYNNQAWDILAGKEGFSQKVLSLADYLPYRMVVAVDEKSEDALKAIGFMVDFLPDKEFDNNAMDICWDQDTIHESFKDAKVVRDEFADIEENDQRNVGDYVVTGLLVPDYDAQDKFNRSINDENRVLWMGIGG